jgi:hypothetical protein
VEFLTSGYLQIFRKDCDAAIKGRENMAKQHSFGFLKYLTYGAGFKRNLMRISMLLIVAILMVLTPGTVISLDGSEGLTFPLFKAGPEPIKTGVEAAAKAQVEATKLTDSALPDIEPVEIVPDSYLEEPSGNEQIIWNYLLDYGFSDAQAAGIMGNFMQEHRLQTSGNGLAQWMGSRFNKLKARGNYTSIYTQLGFLMDELNGPYIGVRNRLYNSVTVDQATLIFQNGYERPGIPAASKRLSFAHAIYNKYHVE